MSVRAIIVNIKNFYKEKKVLVITILIVLFIFSMSVQLYLFSTEKIYADELRFEFVDWTVTCDGKIYTVQEKEDFCSRCYNDPGFECRWPLDMNITIDRVESVIMTGGEMHCFFIIDGINHYTEKGSYYGLDSNNLFTWQLLRADESHEVKFCCGIDRESPIATMIGWTKSWEQACITYNITERCGSEYKIIND